MLNHRKADADVVPGYEAAPHLDRRSFENQLEAACYVDPDPVNASWKNYKRSLVEVPGSMATAAQRWIVTTARFTDGSVAVFAERIDEWGRAVQVILPHQVVVRVEAHVDRLQAENRSRQGRINTPPAS